MKFIEKLLKRGQLQTINIQKKMKLGSLAYDWSLLWHTLPIFRLREKKQTKLVFNFSLLSYFEKNISFFLFLNKK